MNILTFDIEDWWVYEQYSGSDKKDYLTRLNGYLDMILDLLSERSIKATFFCLGQVAEKNPEVIKKISDKKQQIGCHSFSHKFLGETTPKEVAEDTRKALDTIENITGEKVIAYRAPSFSIMEKNIWILGVLIENGIIFDSSIFPAKRSFGGFPGFSQKTPSIINYNGVSIKEFPISTTSFLGKEVVYSGGGYFRLFPYWKIRSIVKNNDYVMTYFHIYNFDKEQKRHYRSFQGESALFRYFKNYYGLNGAFSKFTRFIYDFDFISIDQADKIIDWGKGPKVSI